MVWNWLKVANSNIWGGRLAGFVLPLTRSRRIDWRQVSTHRGVPIELEWSTWISVRLDKEMYWNWSQRAFWVEPYTSFSTFVGLAKHCTFSFPACGPFHSASLLPQSLCAGQVRDPPASFSMSSVVAKSLHSVGRKWCLRVYKVLTGCFEARLTTVRNNQAKWRQGEVLAEQGNIQRGDILQLRQFGLAERHTYPKFNL